MTTVDGYTILVGPADERRPSRDLRWHICINTDFDHQTPTARCIFEPPAS